MADAPTGEDADLLLRLLELYVSEPVAAARAFMRTIPAGRTFAELREEYPPGSIGFRQIDAVMAFWETVGSLLKHHLLSEDLAFDTFLDAPPWPQMEVAIQSLREERDNPYEGENIEHAYQRSLVWLRKRQSEQPSA
ncbi:MAG TPA: hypothetical protein VF155_04775 [Candidatus Dormibacteraeota bacterium]